SRSSSRTRCGSASRGPMRSSTSASPSPTADGSSAVSTRARSIRGSRTGATTCSRSRCRACWCGRRRCARSEAAQRARPPPGGRIALCRRIWRAGERVAVQSAARVLPPHPTRPLLARLRDLRTGQHLALLKQRSLPHALLSLLLLPLVTGLRMAAALAASAPRTAVMELRASAAVLPRARRVLSRGLRERHRARVPRGRLAPLYLPRGEGMRRWADDTWTRVFADDDRRRQIRRTTWGVAGTRHGLDDADYGRHIVWTAVVALTATVVGLFALRGLFGRG